MKKIIIVLVVIMVIGLFGCGKQKYNLELDGFGLSSKKTVYKDKSDRYKGFLCSGHAEYDEYGADIVCSAVSVVITGTVNSIEALTSDTFSVEDDENSGMIRAEFPECLEHDGSLLMDSMILTLKSIEDSYGDFLQLNIEEV